jgi:xylulokinase
VLPWFEPEITPAVPIASPHRYGLANADRGVEVRALVDAQMMTMALHSRWMGVQIDTIHATGGAAANRSILQTMADVFGATVYPLEVGNSAALGAALRAAHGDRVARETQTDWAEVVRGFAEPVASARLEPDASRHGFYLKLMPVYAACEAHALGKGPDPAPLLKELG